MMKGAAAQYLAQQFLRKHRIQGLDRRLAFDVWADGNGYSPHFKRELWRRIKAATRQKSATG
jgi:hypothetical protein